MQLNECPCKNCVPPKRNADCHGKCPEYKEWSALLQQHNDKVRAARDEEHLYEALSIKRSTGRRK